MRMILASVMAALVASCLGSPALAAEDPEDGDIRNLKVGVPASSLRSHGLSGFTCTGADGSALALGGFAEHGRCAADGDGRVSIGFAYDDSTQVWAKVNDAWEGTKIAGHPVALSLMVDRDGLVQAIRAETNATRAYQKKKAFLLGVRVMGRYGREGWDCTDRPAGEARSAVGGMFLDRHCEKRLPDRRILVDTSLYRAAGQSATEFTGATRLAIVHTPG